MPVFSKTTYEARRHRLGRPVMAGALMAIAQVATLSVCVASSGAKTPTSVSPLAQGVSYRHGVVPMRGHWAPRASAGNLLAFGGGIGGVGVTTGAPKVYLVFWGSQWGSESTRPEGYATFSGDPEGMAPQLQAFFSGLGTGSETWSGVMTQYCEGLTTGSLDCPPSAKHVGYPAGGALAGVWEDASSAAAGRATGHEIAEEAVAAATHFSNTTQASNRNVQYDIVSPTGTNPDGFNTGGAGFCAWHDHTADSALSGGGAADSPDGILAFTNMPYVTDAGASCGQNFVNSASAGTLDGVTIVNGHEYAETITDQFPAGGWLDVSGNENGDKCAWIRSGQGASQNLTLTTGTFAVQSTWANDFNNGGGGCEVNHPIVGTTSGRSAR